MLTVVSTSSIPLELRGYSTQVIAAATDATRKLGRPRSDVTFIAALAHAACDSGIGRTAVQHAWMAKLIGHHIEHRGWEGHEWNRPTPPRPPAGIDKITETLASDRAREAAEFIAYTQLREGR